MALGDRRHLIQLRKVTVEMGRDDRSRSRGDGRLNL